MFSSERLLKAAVLLYLLSAFIGSFLLILLLRIGVFDYQLRGLPDIYTLKNYFCYAFSGAIGGTLYCLRLFYWHNIQGLLNIRKWWIWYGLRPIMSAGTAVMFVLLLKSGLLFLQISDSIAPSIGLAFLVGYGFGKVMDKLDGVTETLFNGHSTTTPVKEPCRENPIHVSPTTNTDSPDLDQPMEQLKEKENR
ncbi:hypothetical protein [Effusibacillus dendaii]|uniref:Uncharacterized protein n=1 Tax=Effusibacillus dendaii TaxID=2743772 RepID=A0A7I8D957_9BACL|nr:hypothetical protein [Effusibacillus dendaii]BCJ86678.1 hypothetical protein skT53_16630 [Effusibacillus dendaii]